MMAAGVGWVVWTKLGIDVGGLQGSSIQTEGTSVGVGLRRSSWGSRLGSGEWVAAWRWQRAVLRV
jgi:hypothetical protein